MSLHLPFSALSKAFQIELLELSDAENFCESQAEKRVTLEKVNMRS